MFTRFINWSNRLTPDFKEDLSILASGIIGIAIVAMIFSLV